MFSTELREDSVNLLTGPATNYSINTTIAKGIPATVVAKSEDGTMMFVNAEGASGWAMLNQMVVAGDTNELPIWKNAMAHATLVEVVEEVVEEVDEEVPEVAPVDAVTADDGLSTGTVTSASDLKNGPSYAYETMTWIPENAKVVIQAQNAAGNWVYVSAEKGGGWLPTSKINTTDNLTQLPKSEETSEGALYMPRGTVNKPVIARRIRPTGDKKAILGTIDQGTEVRIIGRDKSATWVFVMVEGGDGWILAQFINLLDNPDLSKVSLWAEATGTNAQASVTD